MLRGVVEEAARPTVMVCGNRAAFKVFARFAYTARSPSTPLTPRGDAFLRMRKDMSGTCRAHEFLPDMFVLRAEQRVVQGG